MKVSCVFRVWNLESRTCVQEMTAHRKKFDESIMDVAFHPSRPYIASAGRENITYKKKRTRLTLNVV
jgi:striatin 1/3/4